MSDECNESGAQRKAAQHVVMHPRGSHLFVNDAHHGLRPVRHGGEKGGVETVEIHSHPRGCFCTACGCGVRCRATVAVVANSCRLHADNVGELGAQPGTKAPLLGPELFHAEQNEARHRNKARHKARASPSLAH